MTYKREQYNSLAVADVRGSAVGIVSLSTLIGAAVCVLLVSLAAQVRVPVPGTTVPLTLQSFAVLLCGFFAARRAVLSGLLAYLALGAAGMPVFSPGSQGIAGETGGYLLGFVVGAWFITALRGGRDASVFRLLFAGAVGTVAIFVCGITWRSFLPGGSISYSVMTGLVPFAAKAAVQLSVAVSMVVAVRSCGSGDDVQKQDADA